MKLVVPHYFVLNNIRHSRRGLCRIGMKLSVFFPTMDILLSINHKVKAWLFYGATCFHEGDLPQLVLNHKKIVIFHGFPALSGLTKSQ